MIHERYDLALNIYNIDYTYQGELTNVITYDIFNILSILL